MDIYIGNINIQVSENDIRKIFEIFGSVFKVVLVKDKVTQVSKGFSFVTMHDAIAAERAITELDGRRFAGRNMVVKKALDKNALAAPKQEETGEYHAPEETVHPLRSPAVYSLQNEDGYVKIKFSR